MYQVSHRTKLQYHILNIHMFTYSLESYVKISFFFYFTGSHPLCIWLSLSQSCLSLWTYITLHQPLFLCAGDVNSTENYLAA